MQRGEQAEKLGAEKEAEEFYRLAIEKCQSLVQQDPNWLEPRRTLVEACHQVVDHLYNLGRDSATELAYTIEVEGLQLQRDLVLEAIKRCAASQAADDTSTLLDDISSEIRNLQDFMYFVDDWRHPDTQFNATAFAAILDILNQILSLPNVETLVKEAPSTRLEFDKVLLVHLAENLCKQVVYSVGYTSFFSRRPKRFADDVQLLDKQLKALESLRANTSDSSAFTHWCFAMIHAGLLRASADLHGQYGLVNEAKVFSAQEIVIRQQLLDLLSDFRTDADRPPAAIVSGQVYESIDGVKLMQVAGQFRASCVLENWEQAEGYLSN
jgi:hypothetical protein